MNAESTINPTESQSSAGKVKWQIDPMHSAARFSVRHMMISNVQGEFKMSGKVELDPNEFGNSTVEAVIDASTVDTREPARDKHLRSADFFDVEKYPSMTFRSTRISGSAGEGFSLIGELAIHGVTREVAFEVEPLSPEIKDPYGHVRLGTSARAKIDRKEFGLQWNAVLETGGAVVGNQVNISLEIELIRQN